MKLVHERKLSELDSIELKIFVKEIDSNKLSLEYKAVINDNIVIKDIIKTMISGTGPVVLKEFCFKDYKHKEIFKKEFINEDFKLTDIILCSIWPVLTEEYGLRSVRFNVETPYKTLDIKRNIEGRILSILNKYYEDFLNEHRTVEGGISWD